MTKIEYFSDPPRKVKFSDLHIGDTFLYTTAVPLIKMAHSELTNSCGAPTNALGLTNGLNYIFRDDDLVTPKAYVLNDA